MSSPSELSPEQLAEIAAEITSIYQSLDVTKHLSVVAITILIYDILSTLDDEIKYVWKSRWSFARIAFHLNRLCIIVLMGAYFPTLFIYRLSENSPLSSSHVYSNSTIFTTSCIGISLFYVWGSIVVMWIVTAVLIVRVWIIYGKGRWFLAGILASFLAITVPSIIIHEISLMTSHWIPNPAPDLITACLFTPNKLAFLPYITGLIYETLIFALTVFKTWRLSRKRMSTPLMTRLLRDGSCYYLVVLVFGLFSCVGALSPKLAGAAIGSGSLSVVMSCMCSRLILSTRSFHDDIKDNSSCELETLPRAEQQVSGESGYSSDFPTPRTPRKAPHAFSEGRIWQISHVERLESPLRQGTTLRLGSGSRFKESWSMEVHTPRRI